MIFFYICTCILEAEKNARLDKWCEFEATGNKKDFRKFPWDDEQSGDEDHEPDIREDLYSQLAMLGQEKEELEPWVAKEMDQHLTEIWLTGNEDLFPQIFHLIVSENISGMYGAGWLIN